MKPKPEDIYRIDMRTIAGIIRGDLLGVSTDGKRMFYIQIEDDDECRDLSSAIDTLEQWWEP